MNSTDHRSRDSSEELFETLFKDVSSRKRPSDSDEVRVRAALQQEWEQLTRRSKRTRRLTLGFAAAASVVLAISLYTGWSGQPAEGTPVPTVGTVVKTSGGIVRSRLPEQAPTLAVRAGDALVAGMVIMTADGSRLALRWSGGESIRLDSDTRIQLLSATGIALLEGRIYIDTNAAEGAQQAAGGPTDELGVETPFGRVQPIGTRYMTRLARDSLVISVRAGNVSVTDGGEQAIAAMGQRLSRSRDGGVKLEPIPVFGENWRWIEKIGPGFVLDGRSLADFLGWVSRETGQFLEYGSGAAETLARDTVMRGTVDLEPLAALELMLQTSDLVATVQDGVIRIETDQP